jgi:hypothetical protein
MEAGRRHVNIGKSPYRPRAALGLLILLLTFLPSEGALAAPPAVPIDPVESIIRAFDNHQVVALGEGNHGNLPGHELRLKLIREPGFHRVVRDIVVEFGNSRYQDLMDRYLQGEDVPRDELNKVWRNTAQGNAVWDVPIYEEFYRAVRELNLTVSAEERLRVILGDIDFDWSQVRTTEDYMRQPQRSDAYVADVIGREVLSKGRRALIIHGDLHFARAPTVWEPQEQAAPPHRHVLDGASADGARTIVTILEGAGVDVFSIYTNTLTDLAALQPDVVQWEAPKLALLVNTGLGREPFSTFNPAPRRVDGEWMVADRAHSALLQEQFDAILYLGPVEDIRYSLPSPELCDDDEFLAMRFFRMEVSGFVGDVERAKQYCQFVAASRASN